MKRLTWMFPALFLMEGLCFAEPAISPSGSPLGSCPESPNCVSSQAGDHKHAIAPLMWSFTFQRAKKSFMYGRRRVSAIPTWASTANEWKKSVGDLTGNRESFTQ